MIIHFDLPMLLKAKKFNSPYLKKTCNFLFNNNFCLRIALFFVILEELLSDKSSSYFITNINMEFIFKS